MNEFPYYSTARIRETLRERGGAPLKRRGQNFLIDPNHVERIVARVLERQEPGRTLLEIGPGLGALTYRIVGAGHAVRAVEIDPLLADLLEELLAENGGLDLVRGDARDVLAAGEQDRESEESPRIVYGNLPYYITTELILGTLARPSLRAAVFLVQEEFARRLVGGTESSLSVFAGNRCDIRLAHTVPAGAFYPAPDVRSAVITLDVRPDGPRCDALILESLLRTSYQGKRKTLRNNWKANAAGGGLDAEEIFAAAERLAIDPGKRPDALRPEDYYGLVNELKEI